MAEPLILVPGLMADTRLFDAQILALSRDRPLMLALPVRGDTIEEMSQALCAVAPPRFALAGLGLGAHVALDVLRRDMGRVTRLVLMSADALAETPAELALRDKRMLLAETGRLAEAVALEYPTGCLAASERRPALLSQIETMAADLGSGVFIAQSRAMQRRRDQQKTLRRAALPILVLSGAADTLVSCRRQSFMAEMMPSARHQVIENAGHFLPMEQPHAVSKAMGLFLDGPLMLR
jgi:pimeloyl-ACP methyl ester carboxylesterase